VPARPRWDRWLTLAVAVLLLTRIGLMWLAPLADTTEARYGEIARQTVSNSQWLMPHIDPQTPFFAKPPLFTWLSAVSMELFGINEFAARLPSLLASVVTIWITTMFAAAFGVRRRWLVIPVLASSPLFFLSAGAVMTDSVQMMVVCAAHYSGWRALQATGRVQARRSLLAFWAMIGIGALSKGLATWILIGMPFVAYAVLQRTPLQVLQRLADWRGAALSLAIFMPWYLAAEHGYPGFIHYFIIGEHFSRFLMPGWSGDRYGNAHNEPIGSIWIFWAFAVLPWVHVFVGALAAMARRRNGPPAPLARFLWCATLSPLLFFTFSRNIIWTYALTAVPPFAVLVAHWLENRTRRTQRCTGIALAAYAFAVMVASPLIMTQLGSKSDRALVRAFETIAPAGSRLFYLAAPTFSSAFYTRGRAGRVGVAALRTAGNQRIFVVMDTADALRAALPAGRIRFSNARRSLVELR
jgi:4-amino-4-deoxy-L-arabinose transferase-like glycosyltransferase